MTRICSLGALAALLAGAALVAACSGGGEPPFAASGGSAEDHPPSPPPLPSVPGNSPCPGYDPPRIGDACVQRTEACEYGHDLDRPCNDLFECADNGLWERGSRSACFGRCPDTIAAIVPGSACNDSTVGCSYVEGTCACVPDPDGGTLDPAADEDAGTNSVPGHWRCTPPPGNGCPAQRPGIGVDCVHPMDCDYGSCALGRELVYSCVGGAWVQGDYPSCCE